MIERFADDERGGFFTTSHDHEELIARRKDVGDHPIPSGNSSAAYGLLRLAALTGESALRGARASERCALFAASGPAAPRRLRPPAPGDRLPPLPDPRGRAGRPGERRRLPGAWTSSRESSARPTARTSSWPGATRAPTGRSCSATDRGRGPAGRLRLRALRVQGAGDPAGASWRRPSPGVDSERLLLSAEAPLLGDDLAGRSLEGPGGPRA